MVTVRCLTHVTKKGYELKEHRHIYRGVGYEEAPLFISRSINHPWAVYSVQRSRIECTVKRAFKSSIAEPYLGYYGRIIGSEIARKKTRQTLDGLKVVLKRRRYKRTTL